MLVRLSCVKRQEDRREGKRRRFVLYEGARERVSGRLADWIYAALDYDVVGTEESCSGAEHSAIIIRVVIIEFQHAINKREACLLRIPLIESLFVGFIESACYRTEREKPYRDRNTEQT